MLKMFGINLKCKMIKNHHDMYLKCDILLLADAFEKSRNNSLNIIDYVQVIIWAHQV